MARAEDRMRTVQQRLHGFSLMEQISDAIFVVDAGDAALVEVNSQACHSLGYSREELLALDMLHACNAFTDIAAWQAFRAAVPAQGQFCLEAGLNRRDGSVLPMQINARLIEADGHEYVVAAARDLSRIREQDAQLRLQIHALNAAGNAIVITDTVPRILWANAAFTSLTGYTLSEAVGRTPSELLKSGKQDPPYYQRMWDTILAGQVWHGELVNKRRDGSLYDEDMTITPVSMDDKTVTHFIAIKQDISARKAAEAALRESEQRFRMLYERAPVAYQSLDAEGRILEVNDAWLAQLGYPREAVIGRAIGAFLAPGQEELQQDRLGRILATDTAHGTEFDMVRGDGGLVVFEVVSHVGHDAEGRFMQTHCVLHNITERKVLERSLVHLAATDPLTGLANRRHFLDQMALALARQQRHDTVTALLMLDLDWFKKVNDRYGHATGDEVLRHVAAVMTTSLRRIDLLGRLGGEEFAILLPDTEADGAHEFAERLRQRVTAQPARTESGEIRVTLSIGVTPFSPQDGDIDAILARADRALYRAKENGRDRAELEPAPFHERNQDA
jgi:diguanylate cyclase (GGDEF)-like protein/PAS domain S-box-containing protein